MASLDLKNEFLDFMIEKWEDNRYRPLEKVLAVPLPKIGTKDKIYTLREFVDEMRVRDEPYFKTMYDWLYAGFGREFEVYKKYK